MSKSTHFFGTSVFGQLISLIDDTLIQKAVKQHNSDYYIKKFKVRDPLISMLFCAFAKCVTNSDWRIIHKSNSGTFAKTNSVQKEHHWNKYTI